VNFYELSDMKNFTALGMFQLAALYHAR